MSMRGRLSESAVLPKNTDRSKQYEPRSRGFSPTSLHNRRITITQTNRRFIILAYSDRPAAATGKNRRRHGVLRPELALLVNPRS